MSFTRADIHHGQKLIGMATRQDLQPLDQLLGQKSAEVITKGRGRDEIAIRSNAQMAGSVGPMLGVMKGPFHEGGKGNLGALGLQPLLHPVGAGHIGGLHVVRMASTRTRSWVSKPSRAA